MEICSLCETEVDKDGVLYVILQCPSTRSYIIVCFVCFRNNHGSDILQYLLA